MIFSMSANLRFKGLLTAITWSVLMAITSPMVQAQYTINSEFGNLTDCDTAPSGIFIVWWDNDWNYAAEAVVLLDSMDGYKDDCVGFLNMQDTLNPDDGYFYNIYIHHPGDIFPDGWGLGQGTDIYDYPYLTIPAGTLGN